MTSNIEVKVRASNFAHQMSLAEGISDAPLQILHQEDTFFNAPHGRLKLRILDNGVGELIFYSRPDNDDIKESKYLRAKTPDPALLKAVLASALGIKGSVRKKRHLLMKGQTRIHFDEVEGLGEFIELEYVLKEAEDRKQAEATVRELMGRLRISAVEIIADAYVDLESANAV